MRALRSRPFRPPTPPTGTCSVTPLVGLIAVALLALAPSPGLAQTDFAVEFGGSQVGPPIGIEGENARFLVGGTRISHYGTGGSGFYAGVLYGQALDAGANGSFLSGIAEGSLVGRWGTSLSATVDARVLGYGAQDPFPYRAFAAEGGPSLRLRTRRFGARIAAVGGVGRSQIELWRVRDGPTRVFTNDLWRGGGEGEVTLGPLRTNLTLAAGWHRTPVGNFTNAGARFSVLGEWGVAELRVDRWETPEAIETTGGIALAIPIGRLWSLRSYFGRTDPDPLTLAQPGSGGGGVLISRSLYTTLESGSGGRPMTEVLEYGASSSRVRMTLAAPESATRVQLLGDFTLWDPVEMARDGDTWEVELDIPVGTHHFGYLVDGEWYVPDDAPDVVPDEWGRSTATLVIEGAGQ